MRNSVARPDGPQKRSHANEFEFFGIYVATSAARRNHASSLGRSLRFAQQNSAYCYKILVTYSGEDPEMRAASFKMRRRIAAALALYICLGIGSAAANSTDDAVGRANRMAYDSAMRCFVANGLIAGRARDRGDKQLQAAYEAKARASFDIAVNLGQVLGYTGSRVNQDFGLAQSEELPKLVGDEAHLERVKANCKALGLM
jgi:hypothetical protein